METLPYSKEELISLNRLHIDEQALNVALNPNFSAFHSKDDLYVIIGYEADFTFYHRDSKLVCGIVKIKKAIIDDQEVFLEKLVLPFSSKILFAKFVEDSNQVIIVYKTETGIKKQELEIRDGQILLQDSEYLLDDDYPLVEPLGEYHVACEMKENMFRK